MTRICASDDDGGVVVGNPFVQLLGDTARMADWLAFGK